MISINPEKGPHFVFSLRGMIPPVISPLTRSREADLVGVDRITRHVLEGGASGVFVLGSCGEGPTLPTRVSQKVVEQYVTSVDGRVPVLVGIGETSTERALEAAAAAEGAGADALVVMTPMYYNSEVDAPLERHVEALAAFTDLPLVIYNIPHLTHHQVTPEALGRLSVIDSVVALKESSGDWDIFFPLFEAAKASGLQVFQGAEALTARSLAIGCDGAVPGIANLVPKLAADLVAAGLAGDQVRATELQRELDAACAIYESGFWLSALKSSLAELALIEPTTGLALTPLDASGLKTLRVALERVGLSGELPVGAQS